MSNTLASAGSCLYGCQRCRFGCSALAACFMRKLQDMRFFYCFFENVVIFERIFTTIVHLDHTELKTAPYDGVHTNSQKIPGMKDTQ